MKLDVLLCQLLRLLRLCNFHECHALLILQFFIFALFVEKESFLQSEIENNAELDRNIKAEERFTARLKNELYNHENVQNQLQNEVIKLLQ